MLHALKPGTLAPFTGNTYKKNSYFSTEGGLSFSFSSGKGKNNKICVICVICGLILSNNDVFV